LPAARRARRTGLNSIKKFLSLFGREHAFGLLDRTNAGDAQIGAQLLSFTNLRFDLSDLDRRAIEQRRNIQFDNPQVGVVVDALTLEIIA
jgi:hypothetical protein